MTTGTKQKPDPADRPEDGRGDGSERDGPVEIRVLGPVTVLLGGHRVYLGDAKHRLMLAMLVAAEGRLVPTEQLIDQIWDSQPPRTARELIHSYASALRRHLNAGRAGAAGMLPRHHDGGYRLLASRQSIDLCRFRDLRARARPLAGQDDARAAALLRQALSQADAGPGGGRDGGPLADMNGTPVAENQWLEAYRHKLREERRATLIACLEAELRLGQHERLTAELAELASADPPDERIAGLLLIAYYRSGRQGQATLTYQRTRKRLLTELGVEPGRELRNLHQRILGQDPSLDLPPAPGTTAPGTAPPGTPRPASAPPGTRRSGVRYAAARDGPHAGQEEKPGAAHPGGRPLDSGEIRLYRAGGPAGIPERYVGIVCGDLRRVRCADVWVNSENTSMQMARFEEFSVSSVIRYEGAVRDATGRIIDDRIADELDRKLAARGPVLPAAVVTTGPGELRRKGVRRIVHVAAVQGEPGAGYRQIRQIGQCVTNVMAEVDGIEQLPPGTTVLFPLLGAGQGGGKLEPTVSSLLGAALDYLASNTTSRIGIVFFLAYTSVELEACEKVFGQNPKISAAGTRPSVQKITDAVSWSGQRDRATGHTDTPLGGTSRRYTRTPSLAPAIRA